MTPVARRLGGGLGHSSLGVFVVKVNSRPSFDRNRRSQMLRQGREWTVPSDYEAVIAEFVRTKELRVARPLASYRRRARLTQLTKSRSKSTPLHMSGCAKRRLRHAPECSGMSRSRRRGRSRRRSSTLGKGRGIIPSFARTRALRSAADRCRRRCRCASAASPVCAGSEIRRGRPRRRRAKRLAA